MSEYVPGNQGEAEEILAKRPGLLQLLMPFVFTALIFWWIFSGIDFAKVESALTGVAWSNMILAVSAFCIFILFMDVFSFGLSYKLFVEPLTPFKDLFYVRGTAIFVAVTFAPLAEIVSPLYYVKKWNRPILRVMGSNTLVSLIDSLPFATALSLVFIFFDASSISKNWQYALVVYWLVCIVFISIFSQRFKGRLPKLIRESQFTAALMDVTWSLGIGLYLIRFTTFVGMCMTLYYLLVVMNIDLTAAQALIFMPLFMVSVFLPISAGGYGGPQGAAILFLVELWGVTSTEQALAFSILWSTFFLVGRAVVGGVFVFPYWNLLQQLKTTEAFSDSNMPNSNLSE